MVLTPLDIQNKEFNVKMRGYDQDQVNDYLDQIIKDYENLVTENQELKVKVKASEEKIAYFNELKDALNQSIIVAQEAADKVKTEAQSEAMAVQSDAEKNAQKVLNDATLKSNQILEDSADRARQLTIGTDDLKKQTRVFRQRLQVMLESQLEIVKSQEWDQLLSQSMSNEDLKSAIPPVADNFDETENFDVEENETSDVDDPNKTVKYDSFVETTDTAVNPEESTENDQD